MIWYTIKINIVAIYFSAQEKKEIKTGEHETWKMQYASIDRRRVRPSGCSSEQNKQIQSTDLRLFLS
jgi:hypothetical protein